MSNVPRKQRRRKLAAGAAVALGAAIAPEAAAAVIPVNSTADTVAVDGQCTLREALTNANANDGAMADCVAGSGADTINFSGLTFPATIVLAGTDLPITDPVTIDGPGQANLTIDGDATSRIFTIEDADSLSTISVSIDELTLTNGNAYDAIPPGGGAILNVENLTLTSVTISASQAEAAGALLHGGEGAPAALIVSDSTFTGNYAPYAGAILSNGVVDIGGSTFHQNYAFVGGAILHADGDFTLADSFVTENAAFVVGGIALYYTGSAAITNTTISGNQAVIADAGGLYIYGALGTVTIEDSVISGNYAGNNSGGLKIVYGEATIDIRDTEISGNTAGVANGGFYLYDTGPVTMERVRVTGNEAVNYQGAGSMWGSLLTIVESEISGNSAEVVGGLYAGYASYLYLVNTTIADNVATTGSVGGLGADGSVVTVDVSTISGNSAPAGAAGNVFLYNTGFYMNDSVIANGTAVASPDLLTVNAFGTEINYSLVEDTTGATFTGANNLTGVDPQLGPLQNNGGPTQTMRPAAASPVVNAGDPAYTTPPNDQRGVPRPVGVVDMGAVELNPGVLQFSTNGYNVNEAGGFVTVTVTRTVGVDGEVGVSYTTVNGSAAAPGDYTTAAGTLTWADGESSPKTFDIPIIEDPIFEGTETFNVTLNTPTGGATLGLAAIEVSITDNDSAPTISISEGGATEGNAGTTPAAFTVTLSNPTTQTVTVDFATAGVDAVSGTDFQPNSGKLTFNPLVTSLPLNVNVIGDVIDELNETFTVTLTGPVNAAILDGSGTGTITDDDTATISIGNVMQVELDAGSSAFNFTVSLSTPSSQTITVDFATTGDTATPGVDFSPNSGTLTFDPGVTSLPATIQVTGDTLDELNETFNVTLSDPTNAAILTGTGVGTIADDDGAPALSISNVTLAEGAAGTTNFTFDVVLAPASGNTVTVNFATAGVTATSGTDFQPLAGTLTFNPGVTTQPVTVVVNGDGDVEPDETFTVTLTNPVNATLADDSGLGTITNDDVVLVADLGVTKAVASPGPFFVGDNATFTITVTNAGPAAATNVRVLDTVPTGTTFVSAVASLGSCTGTVVVDCNVGTLINGGSATVTLTVRLDAAGPVSNTASAASDMTDPTPAAGTAGFTVSAPAEGDNIPTLSQWMLIALASALAAAAAAKLKP